MIFNSPGNPDGCTYSDEELQGIAEVCREFNVLVIADEIYNLLTFDGSPKALPRATKPTTHKLANSSHSMQKRHCAELIISPSDEFERAAVQFCEAAQ